LNIAPGHPEDPESDRSHTRNKKFDTRPIGGGNRGEPLIEDAVGLPSRLLLKSRNYVRRLYVRQGLSAREIGRLLDVSHSTVLSAVNGFGLDGKGRRDGQRRRKGQLPFGYVLVDHRLEKNTEEQAVIRMVRQLRANGRTLRAIAEELNRRLIPTKNHGLWQAATVKKILDRTASTTSQKAIPVS